MIGKPGFAVMLVWVAVASAGCTRQRDTHEHLNALLWIQTSAEYRAIAAATYRQAWSQIERMIAEAGGGKAPPSAALEQPGSNAAHLPLAIVIDVDETVLDNSPMWGKLVAERKGYAPRDWSDWVSVEKAEFVAGAEQFIAKARGAGIAVFFVTNRTDTEEASTIRDLLPLVVTDDQILTSGETGAGEQEPWNDEKTTRRAYVARTHWIIAMIGDDLGDFVPGIRKMAPADRVAETMKHIDRFGEQWFLLPNPLDGSWETALGNPAAPDEKRLADKIRSVKAY